MFKLAHKQHFASRILINYILGDISPVVTTKQYLKMVICDSILLFSQTLEAYTYRI